jgi:flagellin
VSDAQRTALQAEYAQINTEINSIGSTTNYNGSAVFSNTANSTFLSDGVSPTTISVTTGTLTTASLGLTAGTISVNTAATSSVATSTLTGDPTNGDQIDVNGTTYTFVTAGTVSANGQVAIVAGNTNQTALNLAHAINNSGGTAGTDYQVAAAHTTVSATVTGSAITFTALATGNNNAYTLTTPVDTSGHIVVSGATFTGGAAAGSHNVAETNDLSSAADAQATLGLINTAISGVAGLRGTLGANVNRLQAASNVITNVVQNLTSAEDGIVAANIPQVVANLSQFTILEQSGISALAQANSAQQSILKLLQ